ncbi:hypothetical protein WJX72_003153 [[Myrmecia] bisecta]|uniref:Uncharacterized protein n=1 Tax=[Myrmecia] bisecta TaxID=41462 RepID=A0AAW1PJJ0_9CHLO
MFAFRCALATRSSHPCITALTQRWSTQASAYRAGQLAQGASVTGRSYHAGRVHAAPGVGIHWLTEMDESLPAHHTGAVVVYVTVPNKDVAKTLASSCSSLAACVNIIPGVESIYQWEGKINTDSELLLMIKTRQALVDKLAEHVQGNHPYDVPEVISLPITGGSKNYLKWVFAGTEAATPT